jgi:hypothetical protein
VGSDVQENGETERGRKNRRRRRGKTPWSESASELYRPSDRRLWGKDVEENGEAERGRKNRRRRRGKNSVV